MASTTSPTTTRKQYIYLVRYGHTDPPLVEGIGNYNSDISSAGVEHAQHIGRFLSGLPAAQP